MQKAVFVALLCVLTLVFPVLSQDMNSSKDSEPEQSPSHSADAAKNPGMLRSKVGLCHSSIQPSGLN